MMPRERLFLFFLLFARNIFLNEEYVLWYTKIRVTKIIFSDCVFYKYFLSVLHVPHITYQKYNCYMIHDTCYMLRIRYLKNSTLG